MTWSARGRGHAWDGLMQNKGSAMAFVFVLLVMCVGAWAALSTLTKGRTDSTTALERGTPTAGAETSVIGSTPAPTDTPLGTPSPDSELSTPVAPTVTPEPPATPTSPSPPSPTPPPTPTRSAAEPTPFPPSGPHQFYVIRNERDCSAGGLIGGWVYDASANGLAWANMRLYNDYAWSAPPKQSEGPPQTGKYEFTMGLDAGLFHLLIVDTDGQPLSAVVDVDYQPGCSQRIEWQRVQ